MTYGKLKELFVKYEIDEPECWSNVGNGWISIIDDMLFKMISKGCRLSQSSANFVFIIIMSMKQ
jgi:hypothetical protein